MPLFKNKPAKNQSLLLNQIIKTTPFSIAKTDCLIHLFCTRDFQTAYQYILCIIQYPNSKTVKYQSSLFTTAVGFFSFFFFCKMSHAPGD